MKKMYIFQKIIVMKYMMRLLNLIEKNFIKFNCENDYEKM